MTNVKNLLGKVSNINIISNMDGYEQNKMSFFTKQMYEKNKYTINIGDIKFCYMRFLT